MAVNSFNCVPTDSSAIVFEVSPKLGVVMALTDPGLNECVELPPVLCYVACVNELNSVAP